MFVTLEGIEGSGKTTQVNHLVDYLKKRGHPCVATREPGGTIIGNKIRSILLDPEFNDVDVMTELLLYMADRSHHIHTLVEPALGSGKTVICDRYFDATVAYQGHARGLDLGLIKRLHQLLFDDLKPDLTILLDLSPHVGLQRAWRQLTSGQRLEAESRFEEQTLEFHQRVRTGYIELARSEPERFRIIDAAQDEDTVKENIRQIVSLFLK